MRLNDLDFHVEIDGHGPPLLLLHGFTGSVRAWDTVRPPLAAFATVISLDLIGHGRSSAPADVERYSFGWAVRDLLALIDGLGLDAVDVLGYSMGGRVALQFAVQAPERVKTLILESATAGIEDEVERRRRIESDAALAERLVRDGIAAFVDEWERVPLLVVGAHVPEAVRRQQTALRLANDPRGLANSLRGMGAGQQASLWPALADVHRPALLVAGGQDARYRHLNERMHAQLPVSRLEIVPAAGHTVHLDQPEAFVTLVHSALPPP